MIRDREPRRQGPTDESQPRRKRPIGNLLSREVSRRGFGGTIRDGLLMLGTAWVGGQVVTEEAVRRGIVPPSIGRVAGEILVPSETGRAVIDDSAQLVEGLERATGSFKKIVGLLGTGVDDAAHPALNGISNAEEWLRNHKELGTFTGPVEELLGVVKDMVQAVDTAAQYAKEGAKDSEHDIDAYNKGRTVVGAEHLIYGTGRLPGDNTPKKEK